MPDTLPPASAGDGDVVLAAIAKAAARLAAIDAGARPAPPSAAEVEAIAERVVIEAFKQFGVDLTKVESVEEFRANLAYVRGSRAWWGKAGAAIVTAIMSSIGLGLMALVGKYVTGGLK